MADYIEDPQIAASIDDLKRRWPEIGAAAEMVRQVQEQLELRA